jgi:hypothetical protein
VATLAEAAVSGEFCKWPRRLSHLLMMYGFLLYVVTTVVMIFAYPNDAATPAILPTLWTVGASMIVVGGLWFFFFLRVNVAHDGDSPFHLGRADLFVASLVVSAALGLIWHCLQSTAGYGAWTWVVFGSYAFFTTLLFGSVFWSKFAHMFFKPAAAFEKRVAEANGTHQNLPTLTRDDPEQQARHSMELLRDAPMDMGLGIKREAPRHY